MLKSCLHTSELQDCSYSTQHVGSSITVDRVSGVVSCFCSMMIYERNSPPVEITAKAMEKNGCPRVIYRWWLLSSWWIAGMRHMLQSCCLPTCRVCEELLKGLDWCKRPWAAKIVLDEPPRFTDDIFNEGMILVADFDAPLALEADFTGGAALSELGREASKPCISACVPVSTLTDAESSGANCPSEASRQACAPVSAVTHGESKFAILEKALESNNSGAKCPVCGNAMTFLKVDTNFDVPFKIGGNLSRYHTAHCERLKHANEPLWNFLPKLELVKAADNPGRGHRNTQGSVERFIQYSLRYSAKTLDMKSFLVRSWEDTRFFLLSRIAFARCMTEDPNNYLRCWEMPDETFQAHRDAWNGWIRASTKHYLNSLLDVVFTSDVPGGWETLSTPRLKNLILLSSWRWPSHMRTDWQYRASTVFPMHGTLRLLLRTIHLSWAGLVFSPLHFILLADTDLWHRILAAIMVGACYNEIFQCYLEVKVSV